MVRDREYAEERDAAEKPHAFISHDAGDKVTSRTRSRPPHSECVFERIKRFRRISMRNEKRARNFLAFLRLSCVLVWRL